MNNSSYEGKLGIETMIYSRWFDPVSREYIYLKQTYYISHHGDISPNTETIIGKRFQIKEEEIPPELLKHLKD